MASLNLDLDYFDNRKTKRLIGLLGQSSELLPIRLWAYVGKHHPDTGELRGYSAGEVESICGWRGQVGKMVEAFCKPGIGFLEVVEDGYRVHDWLEHEGHLLAFKKRASRAAIKRWDKIANEIPSDNDASSIATIDATSTAKTESKQSPHPPNPTALTKPNPPNPTNGGDNPRGDAEGEIGGNPKMGGNLVGSGSGGFGSGKNENGAAFMRQLEIQAILTDCKMSPEKQREIYQRRDVNPETLKRLVAKIRKDKTVDDVAAVLAHRLGLVKS